MGINNMNLTYWYSRKKLY